ncbi:MAG: epoxyqueuosine reductase [Chloroflexi bacterium]|nr:epoxyqueuosine reductase [Chloroflexota bacterium]
MTTPFGDQAEEHLRWQIEAFVATSPENSLKHLDGSHFYAAPLVGFADGDDPLFTEFKTIIGPSHRTPREWIAEAIDEQPDARYTSLERLSVICYVLPIAEQTRLSNRAQTRTPSERWAHTRNCGEGFNKAVRTHIVELLRGAGYLAIAPSNSATFKTFNEAQPGHAARPPFSVWSERHAQYVAGLGTFSINDGLITARGIAHRCGSVVTNLPLEPTPRPYAGPYDYCLLVAKGTCGMCLERCPAGAISEQGHDKLKCQAYMADELKTLREVWGLTISGCGLCQTGVPCEFCIPQ